MRKQAPEGTYVITGSTGSMGTTALKRLRNLPGVAVRALYHRRKPPITADNIKYFQVDLERAADFRDIFDGSDFVLSFAGILITSPVLAAGPDQPITGNLLMTAQTLAAARTAKVKRMIVISSSTGYPSRDTFLKEEDQFLETPADPYFSVGWMFRYIEALCRTYATDVQDPLPITLFRPSTIYSEYEDFNPERSHLLPSLIRRVVERERPLEIWGEGEVRRDLIHADDLFDACLAALEDTAPLSVYNIAYGREYSIKELLDMTCRADGYEDPKIVFRKNQLSAGGRRMLDTSRARGLLKFRPKTDMESGIRKMLDRCRCSGHPPEMEQKS
jgi:GDP-L-fucose synthase